MTEFLQPPSAEEIELKALYQDQYEGMAGANYNIRLGVIDMLVADGRQIRREMADCVDLPPDGVYLDVGCGDGVIRRDLITRRGLTGTLIGLDYDETSLQAAMTKDIIAGLQPGQYMHGDMANIQLPDESVDVIMASFVVHHAQDPLGVLKEFHRLLKPGGQLIVSDNSESQKSTHKLLFDLVADKLRADLGIEIKPPEVFAKHFNTRTAKDMLSTLFHISETPHIHKSQMCFQAEDIDLLMTSLRTYYSGFRPRLQGELRIHAEAKIIRRYIDAFIRTYGCVPENIDREFHDCRKPIISQPTWFKLTN